MIQINEGNGSGNYAYQWKPAVSSNSEANSLSATTYTVVISDEKQCKDTAIILLPNKPLTVSLGGDTVVCKGQSIGLQANGNYASYLWDDGSSMPVRQVSAEGNYTLQVTNNGGCTAEDTIHVSSGCGVLVFPSGFTPNSDGRNDKYGPTGGFSLVKNYRLLIYNRFGNLVFQANNPQLKWDGLINNGQKLPGTYVFIATYEYAGVMEVKKGTITLLL